MSISTHVLDTARGRPAAGIAVTLQQRTGAGHGWRDLGTGVTDADGRVRDLTSHAKPAAGEYRLTFDVDSYFRSHHVEGFYPSVVITFRVTDAAQHYHVPLLLSPFGYSTYRGT